MIFEEVIEWLYEPLPVNEAVLTRYPEGDTGIGWLDDDGLFHCILSGISCVPDVECWAHLPNGPHL